MDIQIPADIRPHDGRFGSGPSKVRPESVAALAAAAPGYLGTSHRQAGVKDVVARLRGGLRDLFSLPQDYEVVLGLGGATFFWDAAAFGLIRKRSEHLVFGEFSNKFYKAAAAAPHLSEPLVVECEPGTRPHVEITDDVDLYALTHNETSTGVAMPVARPAPDAFVCVDATSAAAGLSVEASEFDVYYFSPQKGFASDGGLWIAMMSPAALERVEELAISDRYIPPSLSLATAVSESRKDQTYNTPGLASLFLMVEQIDWINSQGGLEWSVARCARSADIVYSWAEQHALAEPFVKDPADRSAVVATIDFAADVDAAAVAKVLRANGILDTEPYRKLGRNQLRIALYPAIEPEDVRALTRCIDHVIDALR